MTKIPRYGDGKSDKNGYRPLNEGYSPKEQRGYSPTTAKGSLPKAPRGGTGENAKSIGGSTTGTAKK